MASSMQNSTRTSPGTSSGTSAGTQAGTQRGTSARSEVFFPNQDSLRKGHAPTAHVLNLIRNGAWCSTPPEERFYRLCRHCDNCSGIYVPPSEVWGRCYECGGKGVTTPRDRARRRAYFERHNRRYEEAMAAERAAEEEAEDRRLEQEFDGPGQGNEPYGTDEQDGIYTRLEGGVEPAPISEQASKPKRARKPRAPKREGYGPWPW